jgi:hypothetical protein
MSQKVESLQRLEHPLKGLDVGIDPVHAVEGEGTLRCIRQAVTRVLAHDRDATRDECAVLGVELAPLGHRKRLVATHGDGDVARGSPVDETP